MTMTRDEEETFIKKELAWVQRIAQEKYAELEIATRRWREAKFRADITQKALDDFYAQGEQS
jgi:hypothetical protein